jgi:hypothetical protein
MYYSDGYGRPGSPDENVSRSQISRMLDKARECGSLKSNRVTAKTETEKDERTSGQFSAFMDVFYPAIDIGEYAVRSY